MALVLAFAGCADDEARGPRTGAIVAHAIWPENAAALSGAPTASHLPPEVITVRGIVTGADMDPVSKDFDASLGQGTIDNVPVGTERTLTIQGLDTAGTVLYEGVTMGLTVAAGQTTDAGTVEMVAKVPPSAPTGVTATAGNGQVTISWSAVSGAASYNLYWSTTTGVGKSAGTQIVGVTSPYVHTGRTNGTPYFYVVTAVNAGGESAESAQVGATPQVPAPGAPTLSLLTSGLKQLNFSWSASAGATYYQLQQDPNGTGAYAQVGADIAAPTTTAAVAIAVHRLNWAQARYRVRACNAGGCGDSAPVAIAPAMLAAIGYAKASNTGAGDQFDNNANHAVALSGDGNTLAVGTFREDSAATGIGGDQASNSALDSGAVYLY